LPIGGQRTELKQCGFGSLNFSHPEWDKSIGWETSIEEGFGTLGCSRETAVTPTSQVNEYNRDITTAIGKETGHRLGYSL